MEIKYVDDLYSNETKKMIVELIKKIKNLPISNERKEKLLDTSLCKINTMRFITPWQEGDNYVCKVCDNVIVTMSKDFYENCLPYLNGV
ncbi:hypothetical protein [Caldisericum sp.]|jgi:ABC-type sulfate transport system substrate-binding protein|uniref:hypothetical protein n=1 Tax=Caldisericum sp. TaxID=2499687 RepID=UPI003D0B208B